MHSTDITAAVARARHADRLARTADLRLSRTVAEAPEAEPALEEVLIRLARPGDGPALERLRQLEGRERGWTGGAEVLVAVVDGELVAALAMGTTAGVVADPFRRTAGLVRLLSERARQAAAHERTAPRMAPPVAVRAR